MEFNTQKGGAAGYLNAASLAPDMSVSGSFDPVKTIGQSRNSASYMQREGEKATGEVLLGGIVGNEIRQVEKYKADLAAKGMMMEAGQTTQNAMLGLGQNILGGLSSFIPSGGGGGGYGGTGSTGGLGNTVSPGDTGKYGSFQDPSADISRALGGASWGMY